MKANKRSVSREYFSNMSPTSNNWQTDLNQLHGDVQMAQAGYVTKVNWNLKFNLWIEVLAVLLRLRGILP